MDRDRRQRTTQDGQGAAQLRAAAIERVRAIGADIDDGTRPDWMERCESVARGIAGGDTGRELVGASERAYPSTDARSGPGGREAAEDAVDTAILAVAIGRQFTNSSTILERLAAAALCLEIPHGRDDTSGDQAQEFGLGECLQEADLLGRDVDGSGGDGADRDVDLGYGRTFEMDENGMLELDGISGRDEEPPGESRTATWLPAMLGARPDEDQLRRAVVVFESRWLADHGVSGWPRGDGCRPSVEAMVVATAHRWVELRAGGSDDAPRSPQRAFETMKAEVEVVAEQILLRMLLGAVGFLARDMEVALADGRQAVVVEPAEEVARYLSPRVVVEPTAGEAALRGRPGHDGLGVVVEILGFGASPPEEFACADGRPDAVEAPDRQTTRELDDGELGELVDVCEEDADAETVDYGGGTETDSVPEQKAWELIARCVEDGRDGQG